MLDITEQGMVNNERVQPTRRLAIEKTALIAIHGIIVHQTGGGTAQSSLDSYLRQGANGAHFLIDKDGVIYQTASLNQQTWHVGSLKARCVVETRCTPVETAALRKFSPSGENRREMAKLSPQRYPANVDAVGIELVGKPGTDGIYEKVTDLQNASLSWLIQNLTSTFNVPMTEIFRHPDMSRKTQSEAATARW